MTATRPQGSRLLTASRCAAFESSMSISLVRAQHLLPLTCRISYLAQCIWYCSIALCQRAP